MSRGIWTVWRGRQWAARGLLLPVAAIALLMALPVGYVLGQAAGNGWSGMAQALIRPRVGLLLANTVWLVTIGTACCLVLGTAAAWLVERTTLPGRKVWGALLAVPLAVPAFVRGYGWISVFPDADGFTGALIVVTLSYYPLVYLPVRAALRSLDPSLTETARGLRLNPPRTFLRVTVPQIRLALLGGALLVALDLLAEFGAFALLSYPTLTTGIYEQYRVGFDSTAVAPLSSLLVALCAVLLAAELVLRGRHHSRTGSEPARPARRHRLGRGAPVVVLVLGVTVATALGQPLAVLGYWLWRGSPESSLAELGSAALTTFTLGMTGAVVTVAAALPVALLAVRHRRALTTMLERLTYLGHALPGIVIALALVSISIDLVPDLYQSATLLIAAYIVLFLPRALISVRATLEKSPPALEESARALGRRPLAVLARVTLPLIAPGLGAAAALVFLSVTNELTTTLLLAPIGTDTLATEVWSRTNQLDFASAAPFAALMVAVSLPAMFLLVRVPGLIGWEETRQ